MILDVDCTVASWALEQHHAAVQHAVVVAVQVTQVALREIQVAMETTTTTMATATVIWILALDSSFVILVQ